MKWYPPYLDFSVRLRARRPRANSTKNSTYVTDYWRWRFSVDTSLVKPDKALSVVLDAFGVKLTTKMWGNLRSSLLRALKKADDSIPILDKKIYRKQRKEAAKPLPPLSEQEKQLLLAVAKKKKFRPTDLLALPVQHQRRLIGWYMRSSMSDYRWLYNQGYRYRDYKEGSPTSMFQKVVFKEESNHRLRR